MVHFPGEEVDCNARISVSAEGVGDSGRDSGFAQSLGRSGKAVSHKRPSFCDNNTSHLEVTLSTGLKVICKQSRMQLISSPHPAFHPTDGSGWWAGAEDPGVTEDSGSKLPQK